MTSTRILMHEEVDIDLSDEENSDQSLTLDKEINDSRDWIYKTFFSDRKVCNAKMEIMEPITSGTGGTLRGRQLDVCCGPSVGDRSAPGRFYR